MDDPTDNDTAELLNGHIEGDHSLVLSTAPGEYVIFPKGIRAFASDHNGQAVFLDEDQHVYVLRGGLQKDKLKWVQLTLDCEE